MHKYGKDGRFIESFYSHSDVDVKLEDLQPPKYCVFADQHPLPKVDAEHIPVWDSEAKGWTVKAKAFFERPSPLHKWDGEKWVISLEDAKSMKLDELANARWEEEVGGLVLPNGMEVKTDRESQALMTGASLKALQDPEYTCNWKGANGWVVLDAMTIMYIGEAVRAHVQACFDKEMALSEAVVRATTDDQIQAITW